MYVEGRISLVHVDVFRFMFFFIFLSYSAVNGWRKSWIHEDFDAVDADVGSISRIAAAAAAAATQVVSASYSALADYAILWQADLRLPPARVSRGHWLVASLLHGQMERADETTTDHAVSSWNVRFDLCTTRWRSAKLSLLTGNALCHTCRMTSAYWI